MSGISNNYVFTPSGMIIPTNALNSADHYFITATNVLLSKNVMGLIYPDEILEAELFIGRNRLLESQLIPMANDEACTLSYLQKSHQFMYRDLYLWAGELRTAPMIMPLSRSYFEFTDPIDFVSKIRSIFFATIISGDDSELVGNVIVNVPFKNSTKAREHLRGMSDKSFANHGGELLYNLAKVNVFSEGGRHVHHLLLSKLALKHDRVMDWIDLDNDTINRCYMDAFQSQSSQPLQEMVFSGIRPIRQYELDRSQILNMGSESAVVDHNVVSLPQVPVQALPSQQPVSQQPQQSVSQQPVAPLLQQSMSLPPEPVAQVQAPQAFSEPVISPQLLDLQARILADVQHAQQMRADLAAGKYYGPDKITSETIDDKSKNSDGKGV